MSTAYFQDKTCLITGAASGIGKALALAAAQRGAIVYLADIDEPQLEEVVKSIQQRGGRVGLHRAFDIADYESVCDFANAIHGQIESLDIVMNVAGVAIWGSVENLRHEDWKRTVDINLMGPIHVIESCIPAMIKAGRGGQLVNVSSAAGLFGLPWHAAYSASKFGLRGVSEVLRYDLKRHRIAVSLVCPGGVDTGLVQTLQIAGVDVNQPAVQKLKQRFQRHAVSPEQAADNILRGVQARRPIIFTSLDIRVGYWFQRKFSYPYEWVMQLLNNQLHRVANGSSRSDSAQ